VPSQTVRQLVLADTAAFIAFAALGQLAHDGGVSAAGFARDALPLMAGWFAAALALRTYARPGRRVFLLTWAVGVTAGVLLRAAVLGRHLGGGQLAFLATSLVFTLLLLVACRAVAAGGFRRLRRRGSALSAPRR
jgi:hypothetical protein